jgi:hypothetical protein
MLTWVRKMGPFFLVAFVGKTIWKGPVKKPPAVSRYLSKSILNYIISSLLSVMIFMINKYL